MKNVLILPTYNERENIQSVVELIFQEAPEVWVMVVDDNSPDGTAQIVQQLMSRYPNLGLLQREKKQGLGKAYTYAFKKILEDRDVRAVCMMDADLSHPPAKLKEMIQASEKYTVVIGSRYVRGGKIVGWELYRKLLSFFGNLYCRTVTWMPIKDCTGGFNLIQTDLLRKIDLDTMDSSGYAFIMELKYLLRSAGGTFKEIPITFTNRVGGESKITNHIVHEGIVAPWKMVLSPYRRIMKYIISGGTAALVNIAVLVFLTELVGWWYLASAIASFILSLAVSFSLQKFWTFSDYSTKHIHIQSSIYILVSMTNLVLNTLLMYFWVDIMGIWYVGAQVVTGAFIAVMSFFVYKKVVFKTR